MIRYFGIRGRRSSTSTSATSAAIATTSSKSIPDEGDVDFVKAIQVYKEVGYPYMLMPDHVPEAPNDPRGLQSFAYCYGYIRALIQTAQAS